MNKDIVTIESLEKELSGVDESVLPEILSKRMELIEQANKKYLSAVEAKKKADKQVDTFLKEADDFINEADKIGDKKAETHKFFKKEYSTKEDRIKHIEGILKDINEHGIDIARKEKTLADIQKSVITSQEALLEVQNAQMKYQQNIAECTKFLFGLSIYSIASVQSIVDNMQLILSGAKKKDLGEMAKQQMFLVMDQLKSQENIVSRLNSHEDEFDYIAKQIKDNKQKLNKLDSSVTEHDKEIKDLNSNNDEIKKQIARGEKKDQDQDNLIKESNDKNVEQDRLLSEGKKKDEEHDRLIEEGVEKDKKHDELLLQREEKDKKQDQILSELIKKGDELEKSYNDNARKIEIIENNYADALELLNQLEVSIQKNHEDIELNNKKIGDVSISLDDSNNDIERNIKDINNTVKGQQELYFSKKIGFATLLISIVALVLSIIQIFI